MYLIFRQDHVRSAVAAGLSDRTWHFFIEFVIWASVVVAFTFGILSYYVRGRIYGFSNFHEFQKEDFRVKYYKPYILPAIFFFVVELLGVFR